MFHVGLDILGLAGKHVLHRQLKGFQCHDGHLNAAANLD